MLVGVRSVGSPPRILLLRGSGSSSEDESPGSMKTPLLRCAVSFQVLSRFIKEVRFWELNFCYDFRKLSLAFTVVDRSLLSSKSSGVVWPVYLRV